MIFVSFRNLNKLIKHMNNYAPIFLGVLALFISCGSPKQEIHIHDRHVHSYSVIKEYIGVSSSPPILILMDHHHDIGPDSRNNSTHSVWQSWPPEKIQSFNWIGGLLLEGIISSVYWVPEFSMGKPEYEVKIAWLERAFSMMPPHIADQIRGKIQVMDMRHIEKAKLPKGFILSIDLDIFAFENNLPPGDFLRSVAKWMNKQKPRLVTIALSGAYQNNSSDMYSFLEETVQALPSGTLLYLESETAMQSESFEEMYRWQLYVPDIRPDPWIWYSMPEECVKLFRKKNVIIKGENRENIMAVWNDPVYKKLQESYNLEKQREILQAARKSIFRVWKNDEMPDLPPPGTNEGLAIRLLVHGEDRGCLTWYKNSGDMELFAAYCAAEALRDPRYKAVRAEEAEETILELTIFGDWEDISNPWDFIPGYHNLWLGNGVHDTILQASLAPQRHYEKEAFLDSICGKAGLNKNAWKENKNLKWRRSPGLWYAEALQP